MELVCRVLPWGIVFRGLESQSLLVDQRVMFVWFQGRGSLTCTRWNGILGNPALSLANNFSYLIYLGYDELHVGCSAPEPVSAPCFPNYVHIPRKSTPEELRYLPALPTHPILSNCTAMWLPLWARQLASWEWDGDDGGMNSNCWRIFQFSLTQNIITLAFPHSAPT